MSPPPIWPPGPGDRPEPLPAAGRPVRAAAADAGDPVPDQALAGAGLHADLPPDGGDGPAAGQLRLHLHEELRPLHRTGQPLLVSEASECIAGVGLGLVVWFPQQSCIFIRFYCWLRVFIL